MPEVQTGVDKLMQLVKDEERISLSDAAKKLQTPETTIQAWVDFLVEEHLLGIEYKFTTPYIYINNQERVNRVSEEQENYTLAEFRNGFYKKANEKELPAERVPALWKEHLRYTVNQQKRFFVEECRRRGVPEPEDLFEDYLAEVTSES